MKSKKRWDKKSKNAWRIMEIGKNHVPIFTGDGPRSFEMLQKVMRFAQQMDCSGKRMEKPLKIVYIEQK